ncbi:MAG: hypothetical protein AB1407_02060 [Spirochaetota bacterium]
MNVFLRLYGNLVDSLSFSAPLRKMRRELNAKIDAPSSIALSPESHPLGVNRWFKKRRMSIAESYITVVTELESCHSQSRLEALKALAAVALNPKSLSMPLNTARVQLALIKEAVKHRHDKRRQLELLADFSLSTAAQRQVITRLCDELNIVELPEAGLRLSDFSYGWDCHVHDSTTYGRKNPTQLVIDAFIKGISRLTIAYGSASDREKMGEALEAGRLLGVGVRIALEFSAYFQDRRFHYLAALPDLPDAQALEAYLSRHEASLAEFFQGLEKNREFRTQAIGALIDAFNSAHLESLNEGYPDQPMYRLGALDLDGLAKAFPTVSVNRSHLAEYLYAQYLPILRNRQRMLKVLRAEARSLKAEGKLDDDACAAAEKRYGALKKELKSLTPELLLHRFFSGPEVQDYKTVFGDLRDVAGALKEAGCELTLICPLEHGLEPALRLLETLEGIVDNVEVYNTQDAIQRDPKETLAFAHHLNALNKGIKGKAGFKPLCGSDAMGRNPKIPGMGFIYETAIAGPRRKGYLNRHIPLPAFISAMVASEGKAVDDMAASGANIYSMGKIAEGVQAAREPGDGTSKPLIEPLRAWRYFNPLFKEAAYAAIGFTVAATFIGPPYALLWLFITGFRNAIADLAATRGTKLSEWKLKSVNFDNVAQSLFWTGFSVPILGFVKSSFDIVWPWAHDGLLFNMIKFFFISFANGAYLATHNTIRGFEKEVVRANFFRSVIAWPFATLFAPLGNLMGIPSIVQAKIWSDFVAGFIEGSGKYAKILKLRRKSLLELLPQVAQAEGDSHCMAVIDLLYLFHEEPRTQSSLRSVFHPPAVAKLLLGKPGLAERPTTLPEIRAALSREGLGKHLVDYILTRYDEERASDLVDLVNDALPEIQTWLRRLEAKAEKGALKKP